MGLPRGLARRLEGWARLRAVAANVPPLTIRNSRREEDMNHPCGADVGAGLRFFDRADCSGVWAEVLASETARYVVWFHASNVASGGWHAVLSVALQETLR